MIHIHHYTRIFPTYSRRVMLKCPLLGLYRMSSGTEDFKIFIKIVLNFNKKCTRYWAFFPERETSSCHFDIFDYICGVMEKKSKLPVVRYVWVATEYSTGEVTVRKKKLDLIGFLESNRNTFDYRWRNSGGVLFWENKYIIRRAEIL